MPRGENSIFHASNALGRVRPTRFAKKRIPIRDVGRRMGMLIAIPSSGRYDCNQQVTLRNFISMESKRHVVLCVPETERRRYNSNVFAEVIGRPIRLTVANVPASHSGISYTREWILTELAAQHKERYVMMLDDDMDFSYRPDMSSPALETIKDPKLFESMFVLLEQW